MRDKSITEHIGLLGFSMGGNVALSGGLIVKKLIEEGQINKQLTTCNKRRVL